MVDDGLWAMRVSLLDALDQISSTRSTLEKRSMAFEAIEKHLATALSRKDDDKEGLDHFLGLQYTFECNVPMRLLSWITTATMQLEHLAKGSMDEGHNLEVFILSSQMAQALSLIQGITLSHTGCKDYLGRKYPIEVLLDLFQASRHMPSSSPETDRDLKAPRNQSNSSTLPLTSIVLDTLLCILVDSSSALRSFEEAGGPHAVVRMLKRSGTPREVRMKCLEFLYFYLLDETTPAALTETEADPTPPPSAAPSPSQSATRSPSSSTQLKSQIPTAPATPLRPPKPYIGIGPAPRRPPSSVYGSSTYALSSVSSSPSSSFEAGGAESRSTSGSSTISFSSTSSQASSSTTATSASSSPEKGSVGRAALPGRTSPEKGGLGRRRLPSEVSISVTDTSLKVDVNSNSNSKSTPEMRARALTPNPSVRSPPASAGLDQGRGTERRLGSLREHSFRFPAPVQPRMVMLKKDVDYEPMSPLKKPSSSSGFPGSGSGSGSGSGATPTRSTSATLGASLGVGHGSRHPKSKSMSNVLADRKSVV